MDPRSDLAAAFVAENDAFTRLVAAADPAAPVPSCPDWTVRDLTEHMGRGDRWAAAIVESADFVDPRSVPAPGPAVDIADWLRDGARSLLDSVARTGDTTPVWTFIGPRPASWWIRRRLHETLVHRADAAIAVGADFDVEPHIAADAITEYLELVAARVNGDGPRAFDQPLADGQSLHLHATDAQPGSTGEWTVQGRPDGIGVEHQHAKATTALRGPARDLLLALVRRSQAERSGVELFGDSGLWQSWLARTPL